MKLIEDIKPHVLESDNEIKIPLHLEVLASLNFYASGSHQRRVGTDAFAIMSQSKVSYSICKISEIITNKLARNHINFPNNVVDANKVKGGFFDRYGVPGIVGIIDGTHIAIAKVRKRDEYAYVNRKNFYSVNTQVICDSEMTILNINARYPGSTHDSHIWESSVINPLIKQLNLEDNKTWIFGN